MAGSIDTNIGSDKTVIANTDRCFIENGEVEVGKESFAYADLFAIVAAEWLVDEEIIVASMSQQTF